MMKITKIKIVDEIIISIIKVYNHRFYWYMRDIVINNKGRYLIKCIYLLLIKIMDEYHCAFIGTGIGYGAKFASPPILPHGLNGIVINENCIFGENVIIQHQVTFAGKTNTLGEAVAPKIGNNCMFGAGCKVIGDVNIGNNVKVGANAVVTKDLPDDCTAVGVPAKIIKERMR